MKNQINVNRGYSIRFSYEEPNFKMLYFCKRAQTFWTLDDFHRNLRWIDKFRDFHSYLDSLDNITFRHIWTQLENLFLQRRPQSALVKDLKKSWYKSLYINYVGFIDLGILIPYLNQNSLNPKQNDLFHIAYKYNINYKYRKIYPCFFII